MYGKMLYTFLIFLWIPSLNLGFEISKEYVTNMPCFPHQFKCDSGVCLKKSYRCDGDRTDCGKILSNYDSSDESECHKQLWELNRFERYERVRKKAAEWIIGQTALKLDRKSFGYSPDRVAVTLYFINETYFYHENKTGNSVSLGLQNYVLSKLAIQSLDEINLIELASYINALIVSCVEPREFYGVDLVAKLHSRVVSEQNVGPLPFIALCNAGVQITQTNHIEKLIKVFDSTQRPSRAGMQAMALMGLSCGNTDLNQYIDKVIEEVNSTTKLVEDVKTTALVLQALIAADAINRSTQINLKQQFYSLSSSQEEDGSYRDMLRTYYILPIFNWKSLVDIKDSHCTEQTRKERILEEWNGEKRRVQYSFWVGNSKYLNATLNLNAPVNDKFYSMMKVAAIADKRFSFKVSMRNGKPYVKSIYDIQDDPETGNWWYFYKLKNDADMELIEKSPIDYMPENGDCLVYWFHYNTAVLSK